MTDDPLSTFRLHQCVQRWQAGDRAGADDLLRAVGSRLEFLARKMLRTFPNVRGWADTADVLQGSVLRLLQALRQVQPESTRHFYNLATLHVRRELLDLARRFARRREVSGEDELAAATAPDTDLEAWCRFHEAVEELPAREREVVGLLFYQGWTQLQVAELLGVDERTVRRYWASASLALNHRLGGELPSF